MKCIQFYGLPWNSERISRHGNSSNHTVYSPLPLQAHSFHVINVLGVRLLYLCKILNNIIASKIVADGNGKRTLIKLLNQQRNETKHKCDIKKERELFNHFIFLKFNEVQICSRKKRVRLRRWEIWQNRQVVWWTPLSVYPYISFNMEEPIHGVTYFI